MTKPIVWYPLRKKREIKVRKQRKTKVKQPKVPLFPYSVDKSTDGHQWLADYSGVIRQDFPIVGGVRNTSSGSKTLDYMGPKPKPMPYPPPQRSLRVSRYFQRETLGIPVQTQDRNFVRVQNGFGSSVGVLRLDAYFPKPSDLISDSQLITRLMLKIKDQSVNLAQALAERKQTTHLFAETARRLATAAFMVRRGNWADAAKHLGYDLTRGQRRRLANNAILMSRDQRQLLANSWLELQYGWRPLIDDVYGSAQAIAKANIDLGGIIFSQSVSAKPEPRTLYQRNIKRVNPMVYGVNEIFDGVRTVSAKKRMKIWYRCQSSFLASASDVGITNPALLAWELLPYSFVVDWFLPVGNWLQTFDATIGKVFVAGYSSTEYQYRDTMTGRHGYRVESNQTYDRLPLSGFPSVPMPSFKDPLSITHMANALALLQAAFFRRSAGRIL